MEDKEEIKIGYARVSTVDKQENSLETQIQTLEAQNCKYIFKERSSGNNDSRVELQRCVAKCKELADKYKVILLVVRADRLSRRFATLINIVNDLDKHGVSFISLTEDFDNTSIQGKLMFNILSSFAEFERQIIVERIKIGLDKAKKDGKILGRPRNLEKENKIIEMYKNPSNSIYFIAKSCGLSEKSIYNIAKRHNLSRKIK